MELKIGADPEVFVKDLKTQKLISGYDLIPGTKTAPYPVNQGAVQVDGMALEFNVNPANTVEEFSSRVASLLNTLRDMIPKGTKLEITPTATFSEDVMEKQPKQALDLGCDPDFNAYSEAVNEIPFAHKTMRTAAGHIHIGWTEDKEDGDPMHFSNCCRVARQLDFYLGLPGLLMDSDNKRRKMYGKAGSFRPKSYGIEYRVLSNFWIASAPYVEFVYEQCHKALETIAISHVDYYEKYGGVCQSVINNGNRQEAKNLVDRFGWNIPESNYEK